MSEDNTRPISVAELLARNGTIGSPPVGGHRRRKRRDAVSVAELTGEIPVIRTGEIPVVFDDEPDDEPVLAAEYTESETAESAVVYVSEPDESAVETTDYSETADYTETSDYTYTPDYSETADYTYTPDYSETADYLYTSDYSDTPDFTPEYTATTTDDDVDVVVHAATEVVEEVVTPVSAPQSVIAAPPRSSIPLPRRRGGPELGHDPRPRRRSTGAEQMSYDPVDEAVDLADLVAVQVPDAEELRSYLQSSTATLFSGETVADDLARRGLVSESAEDYDDREYDESADVAAAARRGPLSVVGNSFVAILQSLLAVVFGAGLFIAFDQLWRWNNIVALALSTLVIVSLVIGVHVVRKTEDFVSILIAVAVGILVTFGPLALQST